VTGFAESEVPGFLEVKSRVFVLVSFTSTFEVQTKVDLQFGSFCK